MNVRCYLYIRLLLYYYFTNFQDIAIMAWSGLGHLYDTGIGFDSINQERAHRLMNAFKIVVVAWK